MTDEQLEQIVDELYEMFGTLPSPTHEPRRFAKMVQIYKYYKGRK